MSVREFEGWFDFFRGEAARQAAPADDAVEVGSLSRAQLRAMFHHGRR